MTRNEKQEIITQIAALLAQLVDTEETSVKAVENAPEKPIEMLTIKECAAAIKGLSEHTVRQLVAQEKIPYIRTGQGNPNITDEFISEKEKIFCWIFEGLQRLIANNFRFTVSEKTKRNVAELVSENCNIIDFLADRNYIAFGKDLEATSNDLFGGYSHWCSQNGLTPMKQHSFTSWLKANSEKYGIKYDGNIINREDKRVRGFKGIRTSFTPFVT